MFFRSIPTPVSWGQDPDPIFLGVGSNFLYLGNLTRIRNSIFCLIFVKSLSYNFTLKISDKRQYSIFCFA